MFKFSMFGVDIYFFKGSSMLEANEVVQRAKRRLTLDTFLVGAI